MMHYAPSKTGRLAHRVDSDTAALEQYQLEEFVTGDILHFDGLVADGELLTTTASRYVGTCLGYANGEPLGSFHFPLSSLAREWTSTVLSAVGIRNGSFHLEAIDSPEGLVFLEIGNRVGGADVVTTFELATGVHLPSEELRILVGGGTASDLPATQTAALWHGWFVFLGTLARTPNIWARKESINTDWIRPLFVGWNYRPEAR